MAYAHVQQQHFSRNATAQGSVASTALPGSATTGHALLVIVAYLSGAQRTYTPVRGSDVFSQIGTGVYSLTFGAGMRAFLCESASSGTTQVSGNFDTNVDYPAIAVVEISGLATSSIAGGNVFVAQNAPGTGANAVSSGNVTPSGQPAAVYGIAFDLGNQATPAAGTGFTGTGAIWNYEGTATAGAQVIHKRVTATTATPATWTTDVNGGPDQYLNAAVVLLEPGAGGGSTAAQARRRRVRMFGTGPY